MQECDVQSGPLAAVTRALRTEALWVMWLLRVKGDDSYLVD